MSSDALFALLNDFNHVGYDRDPVALVCDFAKTLLEESAQGREMLLERFSLPEEHNRARSSRRPRQSDASAEVIVSRPSLGHIPQWSVLKSRSAVLQMATEVGQPPVAIPRSSVERIEMRDSNRSTWQKSFKELSKIDSVEMIGTNLERLSWKGYVFSDQATLQKLAVAASTAPIGWDARGMFSEVVTAPYMAYRRLRFVRFWVETVEDTVAFLNRFTSSDSLYGKSAFTFSLSGLPSPQDVSKAMQDVRSGSLTVEGVHSSFLFPKYAKPAESSASE